MSNRPSSPEKFPRGEGSEAGVEGPGLRGTRQIEVTWGDCDPAGVVFYPRYYAWFDACTHHLLDGVGLDHHTLRRVHKLVGAPLVQASATFRGAATFGDVLRAESHISRVGTRSFTVHHRLCLGDRVVVEGEEVRVWAEAGEDGPRSLRAVTLAPEIKALLEGKPCSPPPTP